MKRFIQVGLGGFGRYWMKDFMQRPLRDLGIARPVAVADIDERTFAEAMDIYGLPRHRCYSDPALAMAENEADFVLNIVPPAARESIVDLALQHDLDILSEKPLADSMQSACRIYRKVSAAGRRMAVTMSHRFDADKQSLEKLIKSGRYGRLDYIVGRNTWLAPKGMKQGAFRQVMEHPVLIDYLVHHFDIFRSLSGSDGARVHALTWNPEWSPFRGDGQVMLLLEMLNGVKILYEGAGVNASCLNNWGEDYWRAECAEASIELDRRHIRVIRGNLGREDGAVEDLPLLQQPAWKNAWLAELFVRWLEGGPPPPNTLEDNIQCIALLFAAVRSAEAGVTVDVQEFLAEALADNKVPPAR